MWRIKSLLLTNLRSQYLQLTGATYTKVNNSINLLCIEIAYQGLRGTDVSFFVVVQPNLPCEDPVADTADVGLVDMGLHVCRVG